MMKRHEKHTCLDSLQLQPPLGRQLPQIYDNQGIGEKNFTVGYVYEVDHLNPSTRTPVQLKSIRVVMVTEITDLNVTVRYPSTASLCNYLSHNKIDNTDIYPFLDEVLVMGTHLAGKVLCHQKSAQEFDDNDHFEGFWLVKNSPKLAALRGIFIKETTTPLMSRLKSNGMVHRRSAERYKKAEINLLEMKKSKGEVFKSQTLRPDLLLEARKIVDDTGLVDHLLKHVSSNLAPGGAEHFRKPQNADGQLEFWLESADSKLVQVNKQKKQLPDTSDSIIGMKDTLPLSTGKLPKARESCGGGPKRIPKSEKALEVSLKNQSERDKATKVKGSSIQIEEGVDLDKYLEFDIFKDGQNKRFETPVADQRGHENCGPISICDSIGLRYAIQTQSYNPQLSAQEPISWIQLHESSYYLDPTLFFKRVEGSTRKNSFPMSLTDVYTYVKENGVHIEANYPFVGSCKTKFPVNVKKYEKMRSAFKKGKPRERFSIDSFKHLDANKNKEQENEIIEEVKAALKAGRPVNGIIWASDAFVDFRGHAIFDQELDQTPDHIVMIIGYGTYNGTEFFKIKNSWTSEWGDGGYAFVTIRQIKEFAYVDGDVYCMGPTPPKRIMVFYTTNATEGLAKAFAEESNLKYAISWSENLRHSNVIFISNDLEDYAGSIPEYKAQLAKESLAFFIMDDEEREDEPYLKTFYEFLNEKSRSKCLKDLRYAVFGLHQIAEKTDRSLDMLGAKRLITMVMDEVQFTEWKNMIWTELDKEIKVEEPRRSVRNLKPNPNEELKSED